MRNNLDMLCPTKKITLMEGVTYKSVESGVGGVNSHFTFLIEKAWTIFSGYGQQILGNKLNLCLYVVMNITRHYGDNFTMYISVRSLCSIPKTNV